MKQLTDASSSQQGHKQIHPSEIQNGELGEYMFYYYRFRYNLMNKMKDNTTNHTRNWIRHNSKNNSICAINIKRLQGKE